VKPALKAALFVASIVLAGFSALEQDALAQKDRQFAPRTLVGQVTDPEEKPLADAVVYLKNLKDLSVKTYISDKEGNYRFNALSPNADYEVRAESNGRHSDTKTLSSFDSRKLVTIHLRIR
jgi:protocatechuate 3,4-dioxygenase beta subunit